MIVWVHFPTLKVHFYHKEVLTMLGNLIGRTIKLDFHTLHQQGARFARIAVEVDISKPLVPRIFLDDEWQKVEYENIPMVCFECGKIGHTCPCCPKSHPQEPAGALIITSETSPEGSPPASQTVSESQPGFGPWMLVTKKNWRNHRESSKKGKVENDVGTQSLGKFGKNGKGAGSIKENGESSSKRVNNSVATPRSPLLDNKGNSSSHNAGKGVDKGKRKVVQEEQSASKGLLGPRPLVVSDQGLGLKPRNIGEKAIAVVDCSMPTPNASKQSDSCSSSIGLRPKND
ncbi:unnamed protein product [Linum trigynum]|uniref:CCHC-type domain-containing protein n=1 Tax=Linum trigynum TaxID=586398 RepID=A0AAV2EUP7_9ROSI